MPDSTPPLLVFDTNILMDVWLGRDGDESVLLLKLAERGGIELAVPEFVLLEFRGSAHRWLRDQRAHMEKVAARVKEWLRSDSLDAGAQDIKNGTAALRTTLEPLRERIDPLIERVASASSLVLPHTQEIHFRGDLRYLSGRPPDRPVDWNQGLSDL